MNKILSVLPTTYLNQLGLTVFVSVGNSVETIDVWMDTVDSPTIRTQINHFDDVDLLVSVPETEKVKPSFKIAENGSSTTITFNTHFVEVKMTDEGIVIDIWDNEDVLDSTYLYYSEMEYETQAAPISFDNIGDIPLVDKAIKDAILEVYKVCITDSAPMNPKGFYIDSTYCDWHHISTQSIVDIIDTAAGQMAHYNTKQYAQVAEHICDRVTEHFA